MEEAMFDLLHNDAAIASAVGDRITPLERDQGAKLPAITYQRSGGIRDYDMAGATGLVESRYLLRCWAEKTNKKSAYKEAKEVARLIVKRFTPDGGFRETIGSTEIQGIFINNEDDQRADGATGTGVAVVFLDCTFWHKET